MRLRASGQDLEHVVVVPGGPLASGTHTICAGPVAADQVEGDLAHQSQIACRCAMAHPAVIFPEADVENPMQSVLDAPVPADGLGQGGRIVVAASTSAQKNCKRCESTVGSARIDGPGPREQFGEAAIGPVVDELGQHVGEVGLWVDAVQLARLDQRGEHRPVFRPFATAGE
jgi:hypothetical protein